GEWLYDVSWRDVGRDGRLVGVPLVAEVEWRTLQDIDHDFRKLLQSNAALRLCIFEGSSTDTEAKLADFREQVGRYSGGRSGDRYMFVINNWSTGNMDFHPHRKP